MTKTQKGIRFRYGFRHDPMKWINESESVPAAQVRTFCLKRPKPGDKAILEAEIEKLLSEQNPDGSLGDQDTTGKLIRLERLGCSPDRENVQRAVAYVCNKEELQDNGTRMGD